MVCCMFEVPLNCIMWYEQQDTIIAIRRGGDDLTIANLEADKYDTIHFSTDPAQVSRVGRLLHGTVLHKHAGHSTTHSEEAQQVP